MRQFSFKAKIWKYDGPGGWYFVTLPKTLAAQIRKTHGVSEEGWGRLKAEAKIGKSKWKTAIWFDRKAGSYLLPVKASIRKAEDLAERVSTAVSIKLDRPDARLARFFGNQK